MKIHVDTHKNSVQGGEGKQSELLKSLVENKKIQMFVLCFSFTSESTSTLWFGWGCQYG